MKKILFILLISITLSGCNDENVKIKDINDASQPDITKCIVVLDSCEYIKQHTYLYSIYIHKGNCRFCEQRRKDDISKLLINN